MIPDCIFEAVNELIAKNFNGRSSIVKQNDIIDLVLSKNDNITRSQFFENKWLEIETVYIQNGWSVTYNEKSQGDSYETYFDFN